MMQAAEEFIGPATFAALTGRPVVRDAFDHEAFPLGAHISLAERAQLLLVAPASADFMAKAAHGLADDLLSTLYLAFTGRVLMAPAMNTAMWEKAAVQRNVAQLRADGVQFIDPESGWLSCRQVGAGRVMLSAKGDETGSRLVDGPAVAECRRRRDIGDRDHERRRANRAVVVHNPNADGVVAAIAVGVCKCKGAV